MAIQLKEESYELYKDGDGNLRCRAYLTKGSSEDASIVKCYEKEMNLSSDLQAALASAFASLEAQVKSEDDLE